MVSSENRRLDRLAVFSLPLPLHRPWLFFFARPELVEKQKLFLVLKLSCKFSRFETAGDYLLIFNFFFNFTGTKQDPCPWSLNKSVL